MGDLEDREAPVTPLAAELVGFTVVSFVAGLLAGLVVRAVRS